MIKFIFEDNPDSAISLLIKSCYNSENIYFSKGNNNFMYVLKEIYNTKDIFVVYFDLNFNLNLLKTFYQLKTKIRDSYNVKNIYVIPIPCIEYLVLRMLNDFKYEDDENLKKIISLDNSPLYKVEGRSYEGKLKNFLTFLDNKYKNFNVILNKKEEVKQNSFYLTGDTKIKAEQLYTRFPVFDSLDDEYSKLLDEINIKYKNVSFKEVNQGIKEFYTRVFSEKQIERLKINIFV